MRIEATKEAVAALIADQLERQGMRPADLSRAAGLSTPSGIYDLLSGRRDLPTLKTLKKLLKPLGLTLRLDIS